MTSPLHIHSRDNAQFKAFKRLVGHNADYRRQGRVWAEGDHLLRAALVRGVVPEALVIRESFWPQAQTQWGQAAIKIIILADALMDELSTLESPVALACVLHLPDPPALDPGAATVVLDRLQDAGNVGSVLRSAAALGYGQVLALRGTAALWSPKVLRAGMGAHFGLRLLEQQDVDAVRALRLPLLATSSHHGRYLHEMIQTQELPRPCAWAFGHEGQGLQKALEDLAALRVRIAQPGGEESLNVAAAAAICLHASATAQLEKLVGLRKHGLQMG